jgi:ribonuclease-3 family protein
MNGSVLAFVGDAVMALYVKTYLVSSGYTKSKELQQLSELFLSATAQAAFAKHCLEHDFFKENVLDAFYRGRNHKSGTIPKNSDVTTYRLATGLEAVWGYYFTNQETLALEQIWETYKTFIKEKHETISLR